MLQADFGFRSDFNPESRWFALELGGGALLDVGVYPISLASMIFGAPAQIVSAAHLGETGVDEQNAMIFSYPAGQIGSLVERGADDHAAGSRHHGDGRHDSPRRGLVASAALHGDALRASRPKSFELPFRGNGYNYEAEEVGRCLRAGELGKQGYAAGRDPLDHADDGYAARSVGAGLSVGGDMMEYGKIPGIDKPVSRLIQGAIMLHDERLDEAFTLLDGVFAAGCTAIDTARVYQRGHSEGAVGALGAGARPARPDRADHQRRASVSRIIRIA